MTQSADQIKIYRSHRFISVGTIILAVLWYLLWLPWTAAAGPGDLDPTFDFDGRVTTDFRNGGFDSATALAIGGDGKIVAVGSTFTSGGTPPQPVAIARYNPDGSLDGTFGVGGRVTTDFGSTVGLYDVAIQTDHKIVAVGLIALSPSTLGQKFFVARYNTDGTLDASLDGDGSVITSLPLSNQFTSVVIQPDGKIVAAGYVGQAPLFNVAVVRYLPNGALDTTFDVDGIVVTDFPGGHEVGMEVALQPDGNIVVLADRFNTSTFKNEFAVVRYRADGSLDPTFDGDGMVMTPVGSGTNLPKSLAIQPDGKIVAAGAARNATTSNFDIALVRYNPDGTLDNTFSGDGKVVSTFLNQFSSQRESLANGVVIQTDGKIMVGGLIVSEAGSTHDFALVRYKADGQLDPTFGQGGVVSTDFSTGVNPNEEGAEGIALQADGKPVLVGTTYLPSNSNLRDFALARYDGISVLENQSPVANAGQDQSVDELAPVTLDGSGSSDPDDDPLTYQWTQVAGTAVSLNLSDPVHPTFTAPSVPVGGETLTFQLVVNDGTLSSDPDTVNITVKNVNHPPVADAGDDQTVQEGSPVTLDGSASFDVDNETLIYNWAQTAGPSVTLSDPSIAQPFFTAPQVGPGGETLTFNLAVSDGIDTAVDSVHVIVENVNHPPLANAGSDQSISEESPVILDGTGSSDPDGDGLTYTWGQSAGTPVTLSSNHSPTPSFTAPSVAAGGETLVFSLTVSDGDLSSVPDLVNIQVLNTNDPPACSLAQANPMKLWPPNHKLISVGIINVTDPNNDQVALTVTGVTQDEPVNGLGDGDTSPDAVLQGESVLIRSERSGADNGRVYKIHFTAEDIEGGSCAGFVSVSVPHSKKDTAVDSGQAYNSTAP